MLGCGQQCKSELNQIDILYSYQINLRLKFNCFKIHIKNKINNWISIVDARVYMEIISRKLKLNKTF